LGDHLDRLELSAFHITWTDDSVILGYQPVDGDWNYRSFRAEELRQRGLHRRLLRSSRWRDRDSRSQLSTFTIITTHANALLRPIHGRMPVIYDEQPSQGVNTMAAAIIYKSL
jgi:hypothetical protein